MRRRTFWIIIALVLGILLVGLYFGLSTEKVCSQIINPLNGSKQYVCKSLQHISGVLCTVKNNIAYCSNTPVPNGLPTNGIKLNGSLAGA